MTDYKDGLAAIQAAKRDREAKATKNAEVIDQAWEEAKVEDALRAKATDLEMVAANSAADAQEAIHEADEMLSGGDLSEDEKYGVDQIKAQAQSEIDEISRAQAELSGVQAEIGRLNEKSEAGSGMPVEAAVGTGKEMKEQEPVLSDEEKAEMQSKYYNAFIEERRRDSVLLELEKTLDRKKQQYQIDHPEAKLEDYNLTDVVKGQLFREQFNRLVQDGKLTEAVMYAAYEPMNRNRGAGHPIVEAVSDLDPAIFSSKLEELKQGLLTKEQQQGMPKILFNTYFRNKASPIFAGKGNRDANATDYLDKNPDVLDSLVEKIAEETPSLDKAKEKFLFTLLVDEMAKNEDFRSRAEAYAKSEGLGIEEKRGRQFPLEHRIKIATHFESEILKRRNYNLEKYKSTIATDYLVDADSYAEEQSAGLRALDTATEVTQQRALVAVTENFADALLYFLENGKGAAYKHFGGIDSDITRREFTLRHVSRPENVVKNLDSIKDAETRKRIVKKLEEGISDLKKEVNKNDPELDVLLEKLGQIISG